MKWRSGVKMSRFNETHVLPFKFDIPNYTKEYIEKNGAPKSLEDLDNHRILTFGDFVTHPYSNVNWVLRAGCAAGVIREPYMQINSFAGLKSMAEAGFGVVTLLAQNPMLLKSNLVPILPEEEGPVIDCYFIYPMQLKNSKRVIVFREYLQHLLEILEKQGHS